MPTLISLPAGRSYRRSQETKWVDPQPEKGTIELGLDPGMGIVNFIWRNKDTSTAEDDYFVFPGEATFERIVADPSGRSFALKFNSSNQVHFFWLQRSTLTDADARGTTDINALIQDPTYELGSAPIDPAHRVSATPAPKGEAARDIPPTPSAPQKASASTSAAAASGAAATPAPQDKKNEDMAKLFYQWANQSLPIPEDDASLTDILSPETVSRLVSEKPELAAQLAVHMPADLELPSGEPLASAAGLQRVVGTPQFRDAVANLELALRSGAIPDSMVPWAHSPGGDAWNLRSFLAALRDAGKEEKDEDKMETD